MTLGLKQSVTNERLTSIILLCANLIPLIGVLFFDWDVRTVMLLYWVENLIVGLTNIVRILFLAQSPNLSIEIAEISGTISPIDMVQNLPSVYLYLQQVLGMTASVALLGMLLSHGFSLNTHYFKAGEQQRLTVSKAMHLPYKRIFVMHLGLMGGVFLIEEFGSTVWLLVALVVAKIVVDLTFHRKEHRDLRSSKSAQIL